MTTNTRPHYLTNLRLPAWLLPKDWPQTTNHEPVLADLEITQGRFTAITPSTKKESNTRPYSAENALDLVGRLALPPLIDAHTHLDKTFTSERIGQPEPGLLAAIDAMKKDKALWTKEDLIQRTDRALSEAKNNGVTLLRSHVDWYTQETPFAWKILGEQAQRWQNDVCLQRVALIPLPLFDTDEHADQLGQVVKTSDNAILGGFIHSSNFDAKAIERLVHTAIKFDLDLDLHLDEELNPDSQGLNCLLGVLENVPFAGRIVCSHVCALSQKETDEAAKLLDRIAQQPITLIALPATNLLMQDAVTGRTPRQRGLTLVQEAKSRSIPVLFANDNVQDAFCPFGSYDPVEALKLGVYSAQLSHVFDDWSQSICRTDWLARPAPRFSLLEKAANLTIFDTTSPAAWPSQPNRWLLQHGQWSEANPCSIYPTYVH